MKNQINLLLRETISTVNNGHRIYTADEVTNLLWTIQAKIEEVPDVDQPVGRWFTQKEVEQMLFAFGIQVLKDQIEYINNMNCEIDTDEIELDSEDDFEVDIVGNLRLDIRYTGSFRYTGEEINVIVARELETETFNQDLTDDVSLFMMNELSRQENEAFNDSSEFTITEK